VVNKGKMIVDGAVDPHDLLRTAGWALGLPRELKRGRRRLGVGAPSS